MEGDEHVAPETGRRIISIHALRVEGDGGCRRGACRCAGHFYPRPPGGGRHDARVGLPLKNAFLSTPSGWRATFLRYIELPETQISIHALRVEGDAFFPRQPARRQNFYPRPPGGGRRVFPAPTCPPTKFLSTPSGWRATRKNGTTDSSALFLSTPSGWRATSPLFGLFFTGPISIHALRVEGDWSRAFPRIMQQHFYPRPPGGGRHKCQVYYNQKKGFLSTPSGWRATEEYRVMQERGFISIHALRVEGDR